MTSSHRDDFPRLLGSSVFPAHPLPIFALQDEKANIGPHDHDFLEIVIVTQGKGVHCSSHGQRPIERGDAFVLSPGTWHYYEDRQDLVIYNCCFSEELLRHEATSFSSNPILNYLLHTGLLTGMSQGMILLHLSEVSLEVCQRHLQTIESLTPLHGPIGLSPDAQKPENGSIDTFATAHLKIVLVGHLLLLLGELVQNLNEEHKIAISQQHHMHDAVREGQKLLAQNLEREWTLPLLADSLHLNPSYLNRLFKLGTGLPPMAYLARLRAERAANLLRRGNHTISEIGAQVGWRDPSYFAERFKVHFGISPREYRARFSAAPEDQPRK